MVKTYVNGKRVTKEELPNYEIRSEKVKQIIAEALLRRVLVHS